MRLQIHSTQLCRLETKGKDVGKQPSLAPARHRLRGGWRRGCSAAGWWLSLQLQSSFPDQLRKHFHVGPKFLFPVPSHTIFRPSRHFLCWPLPPTSGLSGPLLSGCLQGGPDTRDSPRRDPGLYPAGGPQLPTPTWCHPPNARLAASELAPSLRPETLLSSGIGSSHQDTQVLQGLAKNRQQHFRPEDWLLPSDVYFIHVAMV